MRFIYCIVFAVISICANSQDSTAIQKLSNSFEEAYRKSIPTLAYRYDSILQIHNYSDNWDFDCDGINDSLYFIGTGGAHLYYYLKVTLSSLQLSYLFEFIQLDYPFFYPSELGYDGMLNLGFSVKAKGLNNPPALMVKLDQNTFNAFESELQKRAIVNGRVAIFFEQGKAKFTNC